MQGKEWWRCDMQLPFHGVAKNRPLLEKKVIKWNWFAILENGPPCQTESTRSTTLQKTTFPENERKALKIRDYRDCFGFWRACFPPLLSSSLSLCFKKLFSSILLMPCMHILFNNKEVDGKYSIIWLRGMVGTQCGVVHKTVVIWLSLCLEIHNWFMVIVFEMNFMWFFNSNLDWDIGLSLSLTIVVLERWICSRWMVEA